MLVDRKPMIVDGEAAEYFDCRRKANGVLIDQWQVVILAPNSERRGPLNELIITGTCQKNFVPPFTEIFARLIASLRWRRGEER
jgi:hypothetical protein